VVTDADVDLLSLAPFVENGINARQLKAAHPPGGPIPPTRVLP